MLKFELGVVDYLLEMTPKLQSNQVFVLIRE